MSSKKPNFSSTVAEVEVKSNAFTVPGRTNGIVPKVPKIGNTFKYLYATTPRTGTHGRGLGTKKGGKRRKPKRRTRKH
jgi:hypothetical protein